MNKGRHLFDYESDAGQAFMKDNRLKSYEWTDTGIKLMIPNMDKEKDSGKYEADIATGPEKYNQKSIEVIEICGQSFSVMITFII